MILSNKQFDLDTSDFVIVDRVKYKGTPELYELIFKRIPDDTIYTENDKAYNNIRYTILLPPFSYRWL